RSYYFLNGFYLKRRNRLSEAVGSFLEAKKAKKYKGSVVGELADCYKLLGKWSELRELIKEQESYLDKNPNLLDIYAGMLIAERKWLEAEKIIRRLESLPRNDGRAECRRASMLMQKEGDFKSAADSLTRILTTVSRGRDNVRRLRALAATYSGDLKTARSDVDYLRSRSDGPYSVRRIETAILLKEQRFDEALEHWSRFSNPNAADYLLKARLLEAKGNNALIPISERERLKEEAVMLRARYGIVDEFGDQQIPYERLKAAFDEQ
ncbi:MAG: hypothetical protein HYS63_06295, partial [Methylocystis sp.]|nr:hypothetical protein [Methylocystis sp.]